ncbi:MAG: NAD-dependent epimerase/dehydratase family protein [Gemmataceae bacterium]
MSKPLVLVTGSAGRIGQAVVKELVARSHPVRGFDRVPTPGLEDAIVGSITDADTVRRSVQGVKTLIHLAATPDDCDDVVGELVPNNIVGVYHLLEAAREAGVQRLILASSGQVVWYLREVGPWPIGVEVLPRPKYWYAATKMFLESIGRSFVDVHGLSVLIVRLGWCPRTREQVEEIRSLDWAKDVYLSPGDAGRFYASAVEAPAFDFGIVYATSIPYAKERVSLQPARALLGYEPQEKWPQGIELIVGNR